MADLGKTYIYRMTHIENINHILEHGVTHISSQNRNPNYIPIGDGSIIRSRNMHVLKNERIIGDYIPFYFGVRMPMLYVIQKGFNGVQVTPPNEIVYCVSTVQNIIDHQLRFIFTDGHAIDGLSDVYLPNWVREIDSIIDQKAIWSKYWNDPKDLDLKRRKEAEFLIESDVPFSALNGFIVYDEKAKRTLLNLGVDEKGILIKPDCYF